MSAATLANRELPRLDVAGMPENLNDVLALDTPAANVPNEQTLALAELQPKPSLTPNKPSPKPRRKWIRTTLRALAAQQA